MRVLSIRFSPRFHAVLTRIDKKSSLYWVYVPKIKINNHTRNTFVYENIVFSTSVERYIARILTTKIGNFRAVVFTESPCWVVFKFISIVTVCNYQTTYPLSARGRKIYRHTCVSYFVNDITDGQSEFETLTQ